MQGYEEINLTTQNENCVPLLIFFLQINAKHFYVFYVVHDLIWSLLIFLIGLILRLEIIDLGSFVTIFDKNYSVFISTFLSFGGFFLLFVVQFAVYGYEIPFNIAKKAYIVWRFIISIIHLFVCLFSVIFFGIFDSVMTSLLAQNNVSADVTNNFQNYVTFGIAISSAFVAYSMLNIFNTYTLIKACRKIQGEVPDIDRVALSKQEGWGGNKVAPDSK